MTAYFKIVFLLLISSYSIYGQDSFTDPRDGEVYQIKTFTRSVGFDVVVTHTWMVENLRYKTVSDSYFYDGLKTDEERKKYGRLYTWEAAKKACPDGWHLPTDLEWQKLIHQFADGGLSYGKGDKQAYQNLLENGSSSFSALLGGLRNSIGEFVNLGEFGYYWSATENGADFAWYYYFGKEDGKVNRFFNYKSNAFSCRCVKD